MGASQTKGDGSDPTLSAELYDQSGRCKFYRNKSGLQFEKYQIENDNQSDFENRYKFRIKNPSIYLVNAYYAQPIQNTFGCTSQDQYQVVTQRIKERLTTINNLSSEESLNLVDKSLRGYDQIYKSNGIVLVKDDMIGFNVDNEVKVWLNSNFALNHSEGQPLSYKMLKQEDKETIMVDNIIELINSRTRRQPLWRQFMESKYLRGRLNFKEGIALIQNFVQSRNIVLNNKFEHKKENNSLRQSNFAKNQRGGIQRISSANSTNNLSLKKSPIVEVLNFDRNKTSSSLEASRNIKQHTFTQPHIYPLQNNQPYNYHQKPNSPIRNAKQSNLTMIRQKIVSGPNTVQQNIPNPTNKEVIKQNHPLPQNVPIRNFSPNPNNFHRPLLLSQSQAQINHKPTFGIQPKVGITFNSQFNSQSTKINSVNKPLTTNNSSVSIPFQNPQTVERIESNPQKGNLIQQQKIQEKKIETIQEIIQNPFHKIPQNQMYRIVSSQDEKQQKQDSKKIQNASQKQFKVESNSSNEQIEKPQIQEQKREVQILEKVRSSEGQDKESEKIEQNFTENVDTKFQQMLHEQQSFQKQNKQEVQPESEVLIQKASVQNQVRQDIIVLQKKQTNISQEKQSSLESSKIQLENQKKNILQNKLITSKYKMGESKVSLKNSTNMKQMISYKDLRNLLMSTKQQKYD